MRGKTFAANFPYRKSLKTILSNTACLPRLKKASLESYLNEQFL